MSSSPATKCISEVPGLAKHVVTPLASSVASNACAPFTGVMAGASTRDDEGLVKEFGVGLCDVVPQRLEREPSGQREAGLFAGVARVVGVHVQWGARRFGEQLRLARALHRDEPPRRFVDRLTDREESVVLMDGGLLVAQTLSPDRTPRL